MHFHGRMLGGTVSIALSLVHLSVVHGVVYRDSMNDLDVEVGGGRVEINVDVSPNADVPTLTVDRRVTTSSGKSHSAQDTKYSQTSAHGTTNG
jgi:hypothetical protein